MNPLGGHALAAASALFLILMGALAVASVERYGRGRFVAGPLSVATVVLMSCAATAVMLRLPGLRRLV
jgi:hypothetical protein